MWTPDSSECSTPGQIRCQSCGREGPAGRETGRKDSGCWIACAELADGTHPSKKTGTPTPDWSHRLRQQGFLVATGDGLGPSAVKTPHSPGCVLVDIRYMEGGWVKGSPHPPETRQPLLLARVNFPNSTEASMPSVTQPLRF